MPSACSGSAAPVPLLLRCRCSGAAVVSPSTTKLDPLRSYTLSLMSFPVGIPRFIPRST
ncbi:unnamed protein product [Ectocarpus sp. CCAP 1310/34]|nr:unnamed protein product [Ectocarpus sp. CCAP 1310/34]